MKRMFALIIVALLIVGCGKSDDGSKIAVKIDKMSFTKDEYNKAFENSLFVQVPQGGKQAFLDVFIARKLMLKQAEDMNLDKDQKFLDDIQLFWEQSLLKSIIAKKGAEPSFQPQVSEEEMKTLYEAHKDKEFKDKTFDEVKDQLHKLLFRSKQQRLIEQWIDALSKKSSIDIDYELLEINGPIVGESDGK